MKHFLQEIWPTVKGAIYICIRKILGKDLAKIFQNDLVLAMMFAVMIFLVIYAICDWHKYKKEMKEYLSNEGHSNIQRK